MSSLVTPIITFFFLLLIAVTIWLFGLNERHKHNVSHLVQYVNSVLFILRNVIYYTVIQLLYN